MIEELIDFYRSFDRYKYSSRELIYFHLEPSISLNQYKVFRDKEITGFINWAYLNDVTKFKFLNHGIIDYGNWKCGDNLCFADLVCRKNIRDMIKWAKDYFGKQLGYDKEVVWLRMEETINKTMRINNNVKRC